MRRPPAAFHRRISSLHGPDAHHPPARRHRARAPFRCAARRAGGRRGSGGGDSAGASLPAAARRANCSRPIASFPTRARLASAMLRLRQKRARRTEHHPAGTHHDLAPLFDVLNARYFENALEQPRLGWSSRAWRSQLGCFDPALNQIVLNRQLDSDADSRIRGRLRALPRDAAPEASDEVRALPPGIAFAGVPPGRKAFCGLRARHEISGTLSGLSERAWLGALSSG